jgi:flavin-dependent dehydrogenase
MLRDTKGWTWIAHIQENRYAWVRMAFDGVDPGQDFIPPELGNAKPDGSSRGADVTWRIADQLAGQGWFLLGDAAVVLDPASSHGVVRALMSGMQAANLITTCKDAQISNSKTAIFYDQWMREWFDHDVEHLLRLYNYSS